jgi:hypothetical protein
VRTVGPGTPRRKRQPLKNQHKDPDHDKQADQENDTDGSTYEFQHFNLLRRHVD